MTDFDPEAADKYSFFFGQNSQKILHFSSFRSRGCPPRFWGYSTFPCRRTSRPPRRPLTRWPASCSRCSASTFLPWRSSPLYTLWPAWRSFQLCCPTSTSGWCCGQTSLRTRRISTTTTTTSIRLLTTCTTAKDGGRFSGSIPTWWLRPILDSWKKARRRRESSKGGQILARWHFQGRSV